MSFPPNYCLKTDQGSSHNPRRMILDILQANVTVGIVHQFPFVSSLQRMSVVCEITGVSHLQVYAKGAPETIAKHCVPSSGKPVLH